MGHVSACGDTNGGYGIAQLIQAGFSEEDIKRIEAPIGVDIHALGAKEIALSILASIIRTKNEFLQ